VREEKEMNDARSVVEQYVAAVGAGDIEAVRGLFADDATWTLAAGDLPIAGEWQGRDVIVYEFLTTAMSYYEPGSTSFEITGTIAEGDRVVLQWTSRARTRTGLSYENECIGVFTVVDGRIESVREYMDTLYAHDRAFAPAHTRTKEMAS
jgi:uncharacterized protein